MRRFSILVVALMSCLLLFAYNGRNQHLSPEEFRARQQAFITEKAELTKAEAEKFFPVYFELEKRKRDLNDEAWGLLRKADANKMSDAKYEEMLLRIYDIRIESSNLDKQYYNKYKSILSPEKIFKVQRAEARFHREMLKDMQRGGGRENPGRR